LISKLSKRMKIIFFFLYFSLLSNDTQCFA
jgi:hypothetical protein